MMQTCPACNKKRRVRQDGTFALHLSLPPHKGRRYCEGSNRMAPREQLEDFSIAMDLPAGSVVLRAVEVVQVIAPDGQPVVLCNWQGGEPDLVSELGMMEYAKLEAAIRRFRLVEHGDADEPTVD